MDMKAEMGSIRKAMIRSGIAFGKSPNVQKPREPSANGKQKNNFDAHPRMAGMKRHDFDRIQQIKESKASVDRREALTRSKNISRSTGVAQVSYLVHERSKGPRNLEMQRMHEVMMHLIP
jgi:hypothetical protein